MAEVKIGGDDTLFVGEDKTLRLHVLDADGASVDITTGWTILFVVKKRDGSGTVLISKTCSISGTYAASLNPQRAVATLADTDLVLAPGLYRYSFKRTDAGLEAVLVRGDFEVEDSTQP